MRGIPASPEAWLLTVARRRQVDALRTRVHAEAAAQHLLLLEELAEPADDSGIPDDRLRLMFACTHPAIAPEVRAPLMLQAVLGFDAATIASAFLVAPAAMAQRLVRAKAKIRQAGISFAVQSAHAVRRHGRAPDAAAIVLLYEALHALTGSPLAALNRAVALADAEGPAAALQALDALAPQAALADYQPHWAARAHVLALCGRRAEALQAYQRAIGLESDEAVRSFLQQRAARLGA